MATPQENLARFQEISNRGLQDKLPSDKRAIFDEAVNRGLITVKQQGGALSAIAEPAATLVTGAIAEPIAGLAGIAQGINPFAEEGAGAEAVKATREALTFQPRTEAGKAGLEAVGSVLEPVGKAIQATEKTLGDIGFKVAGPVGGAIGATIPTAVLTALGVRKKGGAPAKITAQRAKEINQVLASSHKHGIDVLTTDIFNPQSIFSRLSSQFAERIPLAGTGGKRAKQQRQRVNALEELEQSTPRVESADIIEGLDKSANKVRRAAGSRINDVIDKMDDVGEVPTVNAISSIDSAIDKLNRPGKLKNDVLIDELNNLKQTLSEAPQNFGSLREFRTDARAIVEKVDPAGRSQLRSSDKALMDQVIKGITKDLDGFVLDNTDFRDLSRYQNADKIYAQEASKLTKSRLKTVLDKGDVKPELVNNLLFSSSPSEVRLLFKNLDSSGRQNARMSLLRRALDNSTKAGEISPQRFTSELNKLSDSFDVFFRGDSKAEINGLKRLLEETKRAAESGVVTPTGQTAQISGATAVAAGAGIGDPRAIATLFLASTIGLGARVYESSGVRNMLIKLGKTPKNSTLSTDLKSLIPLALEKAAQEITKSEQELQKP